MYASVEWKEGMTFTGTARSGYEVQLSASASVGGAEDGFRPLELMALSLASCTGMDVLSILRKKRQEIHDYKVDIDVKQPNEHPYIFTHITVHYTITGKDINPQAVDRAIELSRTRYCPASAMLEKAAEIEHTYTIVEA